MTKAALIARQLLWQNRWLFLLLMLWPYGMAALLLSGGRHPDPEDVLAILHQECIYSLALVAVTGSTQLGNEQRSRRIVAVLAQAVSRVEYLAAILVTAIVPLLLFLTGFAISGEALARSAGMPGGGVIFMALLQAVLGVWGAAVSILFSVLLPPVFASIATMAAVGLFAVAGSYGVAGPGRLLLNEFKAGFETGSVSQTIGDLVLSAVCGVACFAAAWWIFNRRDLNLTSQ